MGWMHDTLQYMQRDPVHRRHHHNELTFRAMYAWSEHYMLALSHDEVVHGKGSLYRKMVGDTWQKMANLRLLYGWMYAQPGKKLLFMGAEFAQDREWDHDGELMWSSLEDEGCAGIMEFVASLNAIYREQPAMHELDFSPEGFTWVQAEDHAQSVLAFLRWDRARARPVLIVCNFTPVVRHDYRLGVPDLQGVQAWRELLNSDASMHGGSGVTNHTLEVKDEPLHAQHRSLSLTLPPLSIVMLGPCLPEHPIKK
jgi:1,4-alpha-glucan branching enzyme